MKMFRNRQEAAEQLAERLQEFKDQDAVILAIPRGGVPMGAYIANELNLPLEVALSKKIGHPNNPEYAIGAVSLDSIILNEDVNVSEEYLNQEIERIKAELQRRYQLFMGDKKPADLKNKIVIIVDDGIATGQTLLATIGLVKKQEPAKIVIAVPVGPPTTVARFESLVDEMICLMAPPGFYAVGQFYEEFQQVSDEEVSEAMREVSSRDRA